MKDDIGDEKVDFHQNSPVQVISNVRISAITETVSLYVCLPQSYGSSERRYPVVYFHDGHTVFANTAPHRKESLSVDEAMNELRRRFLPKEFIAVGIGIPDSYRRSLLNPVGLFDASGLTLIEPYSESIACEIKPLIDRTYRTLIGREHTSVCGFSAGAAASVYLIQRRNDIFARAGAFSFTMARTMREYLKAEEGTFTRFGMTRIYMDVGDREREDLPLDIRPFFVEDPAEALMDWEKQLSSMEDKKLNVYLRIVSGGHHRIQDAAKRVADALDWLLSESER